MSRFGLRRLCALGALPWLVTFPGPASALDVVATIPPLHSLVSTIMQGAGEPTLLVEGARTPHDVALKPSQASRLETADLIVMVGPGLETYARKVAEGIGAGKTLALLDIEDIELLPFDEEEEGAHMHGEGDLHGASDPHVWLDPIRMAKAAPSIAEALAARDPANAGTYRENARALAEHLTRLDADLAVALGGLSEKRFIAFHDAYGYLSERYGLREVERFTLDPARRPGAATMRRIGSAIEGGVRCVFAEPQFDAGVVERALSGRDVVIGTLDPLGAGLTPGPGLYDALMRKNAEAFVECLGRGR